MFKKFIQIIMLILCAFYFIYIIADKVILPFYFHVSEQKVTNVIGLNVSNAIRKLEKQNINIDTIYYIKSQKDELIGTVVDMSPRAGAMVKENSYIELTVLDEMEMVLIPELIDKNINTAIVILESSAIDIDTLIFDYHDIICTDPRIIEDIYDFDDAIKNCITFDKNTIWFQEPYANSLVRKGEKVTLFVSKGEFTPELYPVPYLLNMDEITAVKTINESGLVLGDIKYVSANGIESNKVFEQYPDATLNDEVRITQRIDLTISK